MNTYYDWDRLVEPTSYELSKLDSRLWEILQIELARRDVEISTLPYLKELADYAYIELLTMAAYHQKRLGRKPTSAEFNEFRVLSINRYMPVWTRTCSAQAYREVWKEIASHLGKMLADAHKRKEEKRKLKNKLKREKSFELKKIERDIAKNRKLRGELEAKDILEHGTHHGEMIFKGIIPKIQKVNCCKRKKWFKVPVRQEIPKNEQLGLIIIETEVFEYKQKQIKAFGRVIES